MLSEGTLRAVSAHSLGALASRHAATSATALREAAAATAASPSMRMLLCRIRILTAARPSTSTTMCCLRLACSALIVMSTGFSQSGFALTALFQAEHYRFRSAPGSPGEPVHDLHRHSYGHPPAALAARSRWPAPPTLGASASVPPRVHREAVSLTGRSPGTSPSTTRTAPLKAPGWRLTRRLRASRTTSTHRLTPGTASNAISMPSR